MNSENNKNMFLAFLISAMILISWTWFYEKPKIEAKKAQQAAKLQQQEELKIQEVAANGKVVGDNKNVKNQLKSPNIKARKRFVDSEEYIELKLSREEILQRTADNRVQIITPKLQGSINLYGAVFDDLILTNYKQNIKEDSEKVVLLAPQDANGKYTVNFNFRAASNIVDVPDKHSLWQADGKVLTPQNPITLSWQNNQNVLFEIKIAIDENYMFLITQKITNKSKYDFKGYVSSNIVKLLPNLSPSSYILHEGPIGVFDNILTEESYNNLKDESRNIDFKAQTGWLGITDKYWLVAVVPDKRFGFDANFSHHNHNLGDIYESNYYSKKFKLSANDEIAFEQKIFAGAKKVSLLDEYSKEYEIDRFDMAVDFGWYYFLTKPFFFILQFFNNILGNYGLAIMAITILIKLAMYPLATKSYTAIARIKNLQPKIDAIRAKYKDKKMQMNKEIMELYKREKVNPASGCLPMLIQIPVFFSLYKVLYSTIDMRHAPFFGWIKDLSAPDPTSIFNLFGLLPFETHGFFTIGLWPIFMGLTMILQQKISPQPTDPTQAKVMKFLPYILIFAFAPFPAGLLIYWTWSNILSIAQQWFITKKLDKSFKK